jgi:LAS superfamily LD-carboxypeptidase LdcB
MAARKTTFVYPVKKPVIPTRLRNWGNGTIPRLRLKKSRVGVLLFRPAANAADRMYDAALQDCVVLSSVGGGYRTYERQLWLWNDRMTRNRKEAKRPLVRRVWNGKVWWLKKMAPVAIPGTSNHGWGLSIDFNLSDPKTYAWLDKHAPKFGFYMEAKPTKADGTKNPYFEPWHWTKVDA